MEHNIALITESKNTDKINKYYLEALNDFNVVTYQINNKLVNASYVKNNFSSIEESLKQQNISVIIVTDINYFKLLTKRTKAEHSLGYFFDVDTFKVTYIPSVDKIFSNPPFWITRINFCTNKVIDFLLGSYTEIGSDIIKNASYPNSYLGICRELEKLKQYPILACDIETKSLKHYSSGIYSISFAYSEHDGVAFLVDSNDYSIEIRKLLVKFFKEYTGKIVFHNAMFDVYILTYQLFMKNLRDIDGKLEGLNTLLKNFDDTMIMAYCCYNSCSGNELSLKTLAQQFAGDYAQEDINDVTKIPTKELLEYNLVDTLSTFWLHKDLSNRIIKENQEEIYTTLFKPSIFNLIDMQLNGLPVDINRVKEVKQQLQEEKDRCLNILYSSVVIKDFTRLLREEWVTKKNATLKSKKVTIYDCEEEFNPNSSKQLVKLIYDYMKLPVIAKTKKKSPSIDGITLNKLLSHTNNQSYIEVIKALLDLADVDKILSTFIKAFEEMTVEGRLYGQQVLGGTVSGRLASKSPNLANLPSGSKYGKLIKSCFASDDNWIFCGLDFTSLEDKISALLSKDPNKLKVYTDGYDSHCLRAYYYFGSQMPDIKLAEPNKKYYKVTYKDGTVKYLSEDDL